MKPTYDAVLGNSLELLATFKEKEFDYFLTSPPFKENEFGNEKYWDNLDFIISELKRITSKGGFLFQSSTNFLKMVRHYEDIKRILIWGKQAGASSFRYEPIFVWEFNGFKINKYIWRDFFTVDPVLHHRAGQVYSKKIAPRWSNNCGDITYENPIKLYKYLLQQLPKGRVVDPFLGTGTTLKACRLLGHSCVGIEINPKAECFIPTLKMEAYY